MSSQPRVSVCLPVYNGKDYLAQAIESVLAQTLPDFELLIADDQSSDGSSEIIEDYARRDKRIIAWRNTERKGLFANYNECMMRASGCYIKPFAQDDLLEPNGLAVMSSLLDENHYVSLVTCAKRWIDDNGNTLQEIRSFPEHRVMVGNDVVLFNLIRFTNWVGEPVTAMFRRELLGAGFDTAFYHFGDIEYWFRIVKDRHYAYLNSVLCSYRRHEGSATSKNLKGLFFVLDILRIWRLYLPLLAELGESESMTARRVTEILAMHLDHLVRVEGLTCSEMLSIPLPPNEACDQLDMPGKIVIDPRETLYGLLREVTAVLAAIDDLKCSSAAEREHLHNQISNLRNSTSWRITGPFRYMLKIDGPSSRLIEDSLPEPVQSERIPVRQEFNGSTNSEGFDRAICDALNYLDEKQSELKIARVAWLDESERLEAEISRLKTSLSWKLSAPLRKISKLLGGKS